jgi:hypothetical protein
MAEHFPVLLRRPYCNSLQDTAQMTERGKTINMTLTLTLVYRNVVSFFHMKIATMTKNGHQNLSDKQAGAYH